MAQLIKIKHLVFTLFIFSFEFGFGQCTKTKLMKNFINKSKNYQAVTFTVKKTVITINSFDLKSDFDTSYTYETYWCIKEKGNIKYLKENSIKGFTLSFNDTLLVTYTDKYAIKNFLDYGKISEFEDAIYFLGNVSDTFYCNSSDSIVNLNDSSFNIFSSFESEAGPGSQQLEYTFNKNGILLRKESFYNIEFAIPKIYSITEYNNCKYYKKIPSEIANKIKTSHKKAISLLKTPKKQFKDSSTYLRVVAQPYQSLSFKPISDHGRYIDLDSVIRNNKITLVYFWFQGCAPCARIKPELNSIYSKYHSAGLQIIGLNDVDKQATVDSTKSEYPNFVDKNRNVLLIKEGYPQILVLNSKGEMIGRLFGYSKSGVIELNKHISEIIN